MVKFAENQVIRTAQNLEVFDKKPFTILNMHIIGDTSKEVSASKTINDAKL